MSNILNNTFVKIVVAVVIILLANTHPVVATVLSIAFVLTLRTANKHNFTTTKSNFVLNNKDNDNNEYNNNNENDNENIEKENDLNKHIGNNTIDDDTKTQFDSENNDDE